TRLYEIISFYHPGFNKQELSKAAVYSELYPGKKYSDTRMRNLSSDLLGLAEKFLALRQFESDRLSGQVYLLETLPARELDGMFERRYKKFDKEARKNIPKNEIEYLERLKLLEAKSIFVNRRKTNDQRENFECYQGIVNETVRFFLASLFKNYSIILNKEITFFKYEFDTRFIDMILWYMDGVINEYENDTCIMLYYYFCIFYRNYDEISYKSLEEFTFKNFSKLDKRDLLNAITNMVNYCRRMALAGDKLFEARALNLFKLALNENLWNEENKIRPNIFRGIVSTAGNAGEYEWCEKFIEMYSSCQPPEHIVSNTLLAKGRLYFDKKEFSKAIDFLSGVKPLDATYKYETDTLMIRIYYELNETEAYLDKVRSFKKWIKNNKTRISARYQATFSEMAAYFERLMQMKLEPDEFRMKNMIYEISENKLLVNRLWFLEKLDDLGKKR
ncbi:MAG TPA: hypothetical protein VG961_07810, partial [Ignavibacteria bacterium]|nr:hypothetical protein [Ignavibacteria bacterium]